MEWKIHDLNVQMVINFQMEIILIGTVIAHQPKLGTHQLWNNVFVSKSIKLLGLAMAMGPRRGTRHPTYTVRNNYEKLEGKGEASIDIRFMIQSHAESMKKIMGALWKLPAKQHSPSGQN